MTQSHSASETRDVDTRGELKKQLPEPVKSPSGGSADLDAGLQDPAPATEGSLAQLAMLSTTELIEHVYPRYDALLHDLIGRVRDAWLTARQQCAEDRSAIGDAFKRFTTAAAMLEAELDRERRIAMPLAAQLVWGVPNEAVDSGSVEQFYQTILRDQRQIVSVLRGLSAFPSGFEARDSGCVDFGEAYAGTGAIALKARDLFRLSSHLIYSAAVAAARCRCAACGEGSRIGGRWIDRV